MPAPGQQISLRPGRFEYKRLGWALLISLIVHLAGYGGYQFSRKVLPAWLQHVKMLAALAHMLEHKNPPPPPPKPTEIPLVFVDVNPDTTTPEPPKDAKYYSAHNTKAANPDAEKETDVPKIDGKQPDVSRTEAAPKTPETLQPHIPQPQPQPEQKEAEAAKPKPPPGDLAMAKPETEPKPKTDKAEQTRPRTLAEALARRHIPPGDKMKQEGGVRARAYSSLDTRATVTGGYDTLLYEAISQHWWDLLDNHQNNLVGGSGQVAIHFKLHSDGSVTELTIDSNTTPSPLLGILCYQAIHDVTTPTFQRWPDEMKREQNDPRLVRFVFTYF